jgi:hypothetical protein
VLVGWRLKGWGRIGESLGECWVGVLRRRCWFKCRTNGGKEGCYCEGVRLMDYSVYFVVQWLPSGYWVWRKRTGQRWYCYLPGDEPLGNL